MGCDEFDPEGRIIQATWDDLTIVSATRHLTAVAKNVKQRSFDS